MNLFETSILGIVQGLTEFLPISSSGHLAILQSVMGYNESYISFDIFLHYATLLAVVVFFRKEVWRLILILPRLRYFRSEEEPRLLAILLTATVITAAAGVLAKDFIYGLFSSTKHISIFLVITAAVIFAADRKKKTTDYAAGIPIWHALAIGLAQSFALLPGISRSGSTIACAILLGWDRGKAFNFSFLLSIPVILGAGLLELKDTPGAVEIAFGGVYMAGYLAAFLAGITALYMLKKFVIGRKLYIFSIYLLLLAAIVFVKL